MTHPVTPADREVFLRLNNQPPEWAAKIRAGDFDDCSTVQLLAGHRIEGEQVMASKLQNLEIALKATAEATATHLKTVSALRRRVAVLERALNMARGWIGRQRYSKSGEEMFGKIGQIIMDDPHA